ncbi:MAG: aldo/keto reductase [Myxococcota bacterium]
MTVGSGSMATVGLGLWKIAPEDTAGIIHHALEHGYRHLDSAADYGNEAFAGEGIRAALNDGLCHRDELWVTSKLWNTFHRPEHVAAACRRSLKDLQLEVLDLYMIHFPIALKYVDFEERYPPEWVANPDAERPTMAVDPVPLHETWGAMERLVDEGLVKNIGVCNYSCALLHDLHAYARIKPAMLQVESHPYLTQERLMRTAAHYELPVTAFSPLGALSYLSLNMADEHESVLRQAPVLAAAESHGKTPAQVVLRWGIQRGCSIIPKTSRRERLAENIDLFDFALEDSEMAAISDLNRNRRFNDPGTFCEVAFDTFHAIYD